MTTARARGAEYYQQQFTEAELQYRYAPKGEKLKRLKRLRNVVLSGLKFEIRQKRKAKAAA